MTTVAPYNLQSHYTCPMFNKSFSRGGRMPSRQPSFNNSSQFSGARPLQRNFWNPLTSSSWKTNKPRCQLCGKLDHTAIQCWHRYDQPNSSNFQANVSQFSSKVSED